MLLLSCENEFKYGDAHYSQRAPHLVLGPIRVLTLSAAVAYTLAWALEKATGPAAHGTELVEGVQGTVRAEKGDGGLTLVDGCGHEHWPLELGVVEVKHDLAQRIAAVAEVGKETVHGCRAHIASILRPDEGAQGVVSLACRLGRHFDAALRHKCQVLKAGADGVPFVVADVVLNCLEVVGQELLHAGEDWTIRGLRLLSQLHKNIPFLPENRHRVEPSGGQLEDVFKCAWSVVQLDKRLRGHGYAHQLAQIRIHRRIIVP